MSTLGQLKSMNTRFKKQSDHHEGPIYKIIDLEKIFDEKEGRNVRYCQNIETNEKLFLSINIKVEVCY